MNLYGEPFVQSSKVRSDRLPSEFWSLSVRNQISGPMITEEESVPAGEPISNFTVETCERWAEDFPGAIQVPLESLMGAIRNMNWTPWGVTFIVCALLRPIFKFPRPIDEGVSSLYPNARTVF